MSERNDLDLDAILAEYHREERKPAPAAQTPAVTRRELQAAREAQKASQPEEDLFSSEQKAGEGTIVYSRNAGRPKAGSGAEEALPARPAAQPRAAAPEQPRVTGEPVRRQEKPGAKPAKKPRRGKGIAWMLLVLALLTAALFGLVRWTVRAEEAAEPVQPEPLRLELGADLEQALDESASSSR